VHRPQRGEDDKGVAVGCGRDRSSTGRSDQLGEWSLIKHEILEKYAHAYTTIVTQQRFGARIRSTTASGSRTTWRSTPVVSVNQAVMPTNSTFSLEHPFS